MREILFRGKRVDNGEWVYGSLVIQNGEHISKTEVAPDEYYIFGKRGEHCLINPSTVGQYTGLTDKNGRKIFEGDIIKIVPDYDYSDDYSISKVYSYNGIFCVDYHGDDFDSTALGFLEDYLPDGDFEVIGNIHDNPELLEVGE